MSFELEVRVPIEDWEVAERLAAATRGNDVVALVPGRRRRWFRSLPPSIQLDWQQAQEVLDDQASLDEDAFTLSPRRHALAETLLVLGREMAPGWTLRCCWAGDEVRSETRLTVGELVQRVRRGSLSRYELYQVHGDGRE